MKKRVVICQVEEAVLEGDDMVFIEEALQSSNYLKIIAGYTAIRSFIGKKRGELTSGCNPKNLTDRIYTLEEFFKGKSALILQTLLKKP